MACNTSRALCSSFSRCLQRRFLRGQPFIRLASGTAGVPTEAGSPSPLPAEPRIIPEKVQRLVDEIANLTLLEVSDLNYALKRRLNLPDAPVMSPGMFVSAAATAVAPASAAESEAPADDTPKKLTFSLKLVKFDEAKKIALIKEIRNVISGLNLVQAKKFVDSIPAVVKEDLTKPEIEDLKATLEKVGAVCEVV